MRLRAIASLFVVIVLTAGFASARDSPDQQREKTRKMAAATLTDLYKLQPVTCS